MHSMLRIQRVAAALVFGIALQPVAHAQRGESGPPAEVKRTVEAFVGRWNLAGSSSEPNSKTASHLTVTIECERTVLGMAVICRMASEQTGGDHLEVTSLIGYSPDDHLVHLMEVSSEGEYHEHKGHWKGNLIQFEPLAKLFGGKQTVEDFSIGFPAPGRMAVKSVEESAEGRSTMEIVGVKASSTR